jgi:L-asparaginase II
MRAHPDLVGGAGRMPTRLMAAVPTLIAKDGAEGVFAAALPGVGAVAVKIDDGALRASEQAVVAGLHRLDAPLPDDLADAPVLGGGAPVGRIRFRAGLW